MPRTVSATEAKNRLGSLISWVDEHEDEVILENRGEPTVVIMSMRQYEAIKALREQARRRDALARLERLREKVAARNRDLSEAERDALADRVAREVVEGLTAEGKLRFRP